MGLLIAREMGIKLTDPYAQKKVSQWESGQTRPNRNETETLARIFGLQPDDVEASFSKSAPLSAADMLNDLAESTKPSLVIACYSGKPRATLMSDVRNAVIKGLSQNVWFAMFFPHPLALAKSIEPFASGQLLGFYESTWQQVRTNFDKFRDELRPTHKRRIMLYGPPRFKEGANLLVPPSNNRYTLVTEMIGEGEFRSTLYSWLETEGVDGLFRVGTFSIQSAAAQIPVWQAYFGDILVHWKLHHSLPSTGKYWQSYTSKKSTK
jgi:transcriptional regulator with XRE-family HTH domain